MLEESAEQPSSVRQCSRLLIVGGLGPIINTYFFQNLVVRNYSSSTFLNRLCIQKVSQFGVFHQVMKKYRVSSAKQCKLTLCFLMIFPRGNM